MDRFPDHVLAAVRESLRRMRAGGLAARRHNYAEIARILRMAGISDHGAVDRWVKAEAARERAREARARAMTARRHSERLRARGKLTVIEGSGSGSS